jgi:hypothetical protein
MLLCLARIAAILILVGYVQTTRKSDLTDITVITVITVDPQGILCDEHSWRENCLKGIEALTMDARGGVSIERCQ